MNTRLAAVPKSWADLEKRGGRLQEPKSADNLGIAVPQAPAGDAYHMYPFFSGLGGYVFGKAKNGALSAKKIGVANKTFLKNVGLIDKWNREGLIKSNVNYDVAKNAFLKGNAAYWITGPWEADTLRTSGLSFRIVQVPKIKFRSVPFLGVQGFMVTTLRSGSRCREPGQGPRRCVHHEGGLAEGPGGCQQPLPREHRRGQAGQRLDPGAIRPGERGRRPDAEHSADGQRLGRAGRRVAEGDEGLRGDARPERVRDSSQEHRQQDRERLAPAHDSGSGARFSGRPSSLYPYGPGDL